MTPVPARHIRALLGGSGALRVAMGALAFGLSSAPAMAECSAEAVTILGPPLGALEAAERFVCTRNCVGSFSRGAHLRTATLRGERATANFCFDQCDRTPGCTSVSFTIGVAPLPDGTYAPIAQCELWSRTASETYDYFDKRPGHQTAVCNRILPPRDLHGHGVRIETDRFRPDTFRPGVPDVVNAPGRPPRK